MIKCKQYIALAEIKTQDTLSSQTEVKMKSRAVGDMINLNSFISK